MLFLFLPVCLLLLPPFSSLPTYSPHPPISLEICLLKSPEADWESKKREKCIYRLPVCASPPAPSFTSRLFALAWLLVSISTGPISLCTSLCKLLQSFCGISRHTNEALNGPSWSELGWMPSLSGNVMGRETRSRPSRASIFHSQGSVF